MTKIDWRLTVTMMVDRYDVHLVLRMQIERAPSLGCRLRPLCSDHNVGAQIVHDDEDNYRYNDNDHHLVLCFV